MKYLFLNQKMNLTNSEVLEYKEKFPKTSSDNLEIVVFPSSINIKTLGNSSITLGSQNVSEFIKGSYTGETSAEQLASYNIKYALVGHSERRKYFKETNEIIKEKIKRLHEQEIVPVLCIGEESKEDRKETLKQQLEQSLGGLEIDKLIIAYEPVYSIGTGILLENNEIEDAINYIKEVVNSILNKNIPVLYGGSVDEKTIKILKNITNIDGFLVGKASLDIEKVKILEEVLK